MTDYSPPATPTSTTSPSTAPPSAAFPSITSIFTNKKYLYLAIFAIIATVAVVLIVTNGNNAQASSLVAFDNQPVSASLLAQLLVPNSVSSKVSTGLASNFPRHISGAPLTLNGKPEVLYIGSEYCPYCAIERWELVIALMRFGNFTGLRYMTSSAADIGPNTPTFTFYNATYSSPYIAFVSRELVGNKVNQSTGQYPPLQSLNASQKAIQSKYDPSGNIPFTDFANKSVQIGANYNNPAIFSNMNWSTIAGLLRNSSSVQAMALIGSANLVTAQLCKIDNNTPTSVCAQGYITNIESELS